MSSFGLVLALVLAAVVIAAAFNLLMTRFPITPVETRGDQARPEE